MTKRDLAQIVADCALVALIFALGAALLIY